MVEVEGDVHIPCLCTSPVCAHPLCVHISCVCGMVYSCERLQSSPSFFQHLQPWRKIVWPCCLLLGRLIFEGTTFLFHHSRCRAGGREGMLKVGPLAVWRRREGFRGQRGSYLLPVGDIVLSSQLSLWGEASTLSQLRQPHLFQLML